MSVCKRKSQCKCRTLSKSKGDEDYDNNDEEDTVVLEEYIKSLSEEELEEYAATRIQAVFRGYRARKSYRQQISGKNNTETAKQ